MNREEAIESERQAGRFFNADQIKEWWKNVLAVSITSDLCVEGSRYFHCVEFNQQGRCDKFVLAIWMKSGEWLPGEYLDRILKQKAFL